MKKSDEYIMLRGKGGFASISGPFIERARSYAYNFAKSKPYMTLQWRQPESSDKGGGQ
jgi:hypothetical protein